MDKDQFEKAVKSAAFIIHTFMKRLDELEEQIETVIERLDEILEDRSNSQIDA